jgi:hypothetical protein
MSNNLRFKIVVHGFDSPATGRQLLDVLQGLLDHHGLAEDVFADLMGDLSNLRVEAETPHPVVISNAGQWRPKFQREITAAMQGACPASITEFDWSSLDG